MSYQVSGAGSMPPEPVSLASQADEPQFAEAIDSTQPDKSEAKGKGAADPSPRSVADPTKARALQKEPVIDLAGRSPAVSTIAEPNATASLKETALDLLFDQAGAQAGATGFAVGAIFTLGENAAQTGLKLPGDRDIPKGTSIAVAAFMPTRPALEGNPVEAATKSSIFVFVKPPNEPEYKCYTLNPATGRLTAGEGSSKQINLGPLGNGVQFTNNQTGVVGVGTENMGSMIGSTNVGFVKDVPPLTAAMNRTIGKASNEAADLVSSRVPFLRDIGGDALAGLLNTADAATGKVLVGPTFTLNAVVETDGDFVVNVHGSKVRLSASEVAQEAARRTEGLNADPVVDMLEDMSIPPAVGSTLNAASEQAEIAGNLTFGWQLLNLAPKVGLPFADDLLALGTKALPFAVPGLGIASLTHMAASAIHGHAQGEVERIKEQAAFTPDQALPSMVKGFDPRSTNITYDTANLAAAINNAVETGAADASSIRGSWQDVLDGTQPLPGLSSDEKNAAKLVAATLLGRQDDVARLSEALYRKDSTVSGIRPRALDDPRYQIAE